MSNIVLTYDGRTIVPSPILSISKEFIYANDAIIGYTYVITLNGFASSVNHKFNNEESNLTNTIVSLKDIQDTLHRNGKRLIVTCDNNLLIDAQGGQLRSFNVEPTDNKWINYAKFSASIEFSNVFFGTGFNTEISLDSSTSGQFANDLLGIKTYNDNWNFAISEEDMFAYYSRITPEGILNTEDYTRINVQYTISSTGKHFYDANGVLIPAWEKAKIFVQEKLYSQIAIFRTNGPLGAAIFNTTSYNSKDVPNHASNTLDKALSSTLQASYTPTILPILHQSIGQQYKIYNETITCATSESDGTFTATYKCVLKKYSTISNFPQDSIHTFTVSYDQTRDFQNLDRVISVNGTVEGMIPTNILSAASAGGLTTESTGQVFSLPYNGYFLDTFNTSDVTKYTYALRDFIGYIAKRSTYNFYSADDLSDAFKRVLAINYAALFPDTNPQALLNCVDGSATLSSILALPQSFSVDHNYSEGSISYTAQYSTERSCAMERGFETFTVTESDSVPTYAEFTIPGRSQGPLIQDLNTNNAKKITFDFQGTTKKGCVTGTPFSVDYSGIFADVCSTDDYLNIPQNVYCMIHDTELRHPELIPETYSISYNPIDGSFRLSKTYLICRADSLEGCEE